MIDRRPPRLNLPGPECGDCATAADDADFPESTFGVDAFIYEPVEVYAEKEELGPLNYEEVLYRHMDILNNRTWPNDDVINFYSLLIMERSKSPEYASVYVFVSFFYRNLKNKGYQMIRQWTRKVDIFAFDLVLIPLHLVFNWCLVVVDFRGKAIRYYDSGAGEDICLNIIRNYITAEFIDKKKEVFDWTGWVFETKKNTPLYINGYNCNMFMLKYTECIRKDSIFAFSQDNMEYFVEKWSEKTSPRR